MLLQDMVQFMKQEFKITVSASAISRHLKKCGIEFSRRHGAKRRLKMKMEREAEGRSILPEPQSEHHQPLDGIRYRQTEPVFHPIEKDAGGED
jgi:hypothetical protein